MKRIVILTRVSTQFQNTRRQVHELESYCRDNNFQIVKTISSIVSGSKKVNRPDLDEIMYMAKKKEFDILLVSEISRISRNPEVIRLLIKYLHTYGIPIFFKNLGIMSMDEYGKTSFAISIITSVFAELAAEETNQLSDRVRSGLELAKSKGHFPGRPAKPESSNQTLKKHAKVVRYLQSGQTISETAKLTQTAYNTVKKIASLLKPISITP
jgi:DNA invertase Pin-like site-specific DNA recombinase